MKEKMKNEEEQEFFSSRFPFLSPSNIVSSFSFFLFLYQLPCFHCFFSPSHDDEAKFLFLKQGDDDSEPRSLF